ncbi:hypothetical protein DYBT9275_02719 [Dyadobacter sp. CECT 9275]|uniref:DNA N-6-adenine-methyltransferase (Dam) n=1 Tax=Dyadobacter helix TaxID=2822344 RepID=A0A916N648_9BACT|nr:phage N-6-adenine-methyltransferase [Dyadobacter sp. CECT 9275]CAG5001680.1 hypothetical protein DYBT9275_02719 [Dyadobacter sp. CECT 9275]
MASYESKSLNDEWYTPEYIFKALECEFDLDVAAPFDLTHIKVPAKAFIHKDSLNERWEGFVWMNPPFSGRNSKEKWLDKIFNHGNGIALTPDRTSAPWWPVAAKQCDALLFVTGKVKFIKPDGSTGDSPSTGTTLFAYGDKAVACL